MPDAITTLATGIEAILRERFPASRWHMEHVPTPLTLQEFQRLLGQTPWIGIAWSETRSGASAGRSTPVALAATVTLCLKNPGRPGRLFGDDAGPGLYPSAELARLALHGRAIDGIGTLGVVRTGQAYSDGHGDLSVAIAVLEVEATTRALTPIAEGDEPPDFERLATSWDLAAGDGGPAGDLTDIIEPGVEA